MTIQKLSRHAARNCVRDDKRVRAPMGVVGCRCHRCAVAQGAALLGIMHETYIHYALGMKVPIDIGLEDVTSSKVALSTEFCEEWNNP